MHWSPVHPLSFITFTNVILRKGFELLLKILFIFFESWNVKFHSPHGPTCFLSRQESRFSRHDTFMSIAVLLSTHFLLRSNIILRTFHNNKNLILTIVTSMPSYYAAIVFTIVKREKDQSKIGMPLSFRVLCNQNWVRTFSKPVVSNQI